IGRGLATGRPGLVPGASSDRAQNLGAWRRSSRDAPRAVSRPIPRGTSDLVVLGTARPAVSPGGFLGHRAVTPGPSVYQSRGGSHERRAISSLARARRAYDIHEAI